MKSLGLISAERIDVTDKFVNHLWFVPFFVHVLANNNPLLYNSLRILQIVIS